MGVSWESSPLPDSTLALLGAGKGIEGPHAGPSRQASFPRLNQGGCHPGSPRQACLSGARNQLQLI